MHIVKCMICGEQFDAPADGEGTIWYKPNARRYAHIACRDQQPPEVKKEQEDFEELYQYVKKEQGANFNFVQFKKVTDKWKKEYDYTYSGMLKSLLYFYEIKKNSKAKFQAGSLGIIPFCYTQAYNYYYDIYMANQKAGKGDYKQSYRMLQICPPQQKKPDIKLFNLDAEVDDEE